jgi:hypothetical protein
MVAPMNLPTRLFLLPALVALVGAQPAESPVCQPAQPGVVVLRTSLRVNPDGSAGSYTPGDHGYTYINNGLNLVENGRTVQCYEAANNAHCSDLFRQAEAAGFGPGSPTFCVYAMEVEPFRPGLEPPSCDRAHPERKLIGNGQGRLRMGVSLPAIAGGAAPTYASTTSLKHLVDGRAVYLDSAVVPVLVAPQRSLLGAVAWLRLGSRATFAILGDSGGAYGEGSIALHQRLLYDGPQPPQPLGPIPVAQRCGPVERGLRAPFVARPDRGDSCRAGHVPHSIADVRAYTNIEQPVDVVVLTRVRPPMAGGLIRAEVTPQRLAELARGAGYSTERLASIASCPS